jgi:hypothetical protein
MQGAVAAPIPSRPLGRTRRRSSSLSVISNASPSSPAASLWTDHRSPSKPGIKRMKRTRCTTVSRAHFLVDSRRTRSGELIVFFFRRVGSRRSRRIRRSSKPCRSSKRPRRISTTAPSGRPRTPLPCAPTQHRKRTLPPPSRHLFPPTQQQRSAHRRPSLPCPVRAAGVATPRPTTTPPLYRPRTRPSRRQRARSTTRRSRPTRRETRRCRPLPLRPIRRHRAPIRPTYPPPPRPLLAVGRLSS